MCLKWLSAKHSLSLERFYNPFKNPFQFQDCFFCRHQLCTVILCLHLALLTVKTERLINIHLESQASTHSLISENGLSISLDCYLRQGRGENPRSSCFLCCVEWWRMCVCVCAYMPNLDAEGKGWTQLDAERTLLHHRFSYPKSRIFCLVVSRQVGSESWEL